MYLKSIMEFDERQGTLSYTVGFEITWKDYRLMWNSYLYGGVWYLNVPLTMIWFPELLLSSPATSRSYITQSWSKARIYYDGFVLYVEGALIESTCEVNVKYYPFDVQSCNTSFISLGYTYKDVNLMWVKESIDITLYPGNSMWDLESTSVSVQTVATGGGQQEMFVTFNLRRKPGYAIVNVLLPILFLGILNAFVFLLIPESGERIGYCITTLLAIAVYMTIIMSSLPQSSDPTPLINYKLLIDLVYSALIIVAVILNMRLNGKDDDVPVPKILVSFYLALMCRACGGKPVRPASNGFTADQNATSSNESSSKLQESDIPDYSPVNSVDAQKVTWKKISSLLDISFFVLFVFLSFLIFVVFISILKSGS
ncbi:ligand-gated ion channel 4-like [Dreissena polymorpha]|nr:ligand-gated ion channel 4-like [Dreissena polymorpha]